MLSRVADAVYWMSRYMERLENVARFVDVNQHLMLDLPNAPKAQWSPLIATTGDDKWFSERYGEPTRESVIRFLTIDTEYPNSILRSVLHARENARAVREIISSEMWEEINKAYLMITAAARDPASILDDPSDFLTAVKRAAQLFVGVTYVTMTHNEAWHFIRLGRVLERADKTSRIVDVKYFLLLPTLGEIGSPLDELQWAALLKSASAFEMYRKRHGRISPMRVADFLLLDHHFPRAVRRCTMLAEDSVFAIAGGQKGSGTTIAEKRLGRLRAKLEFLTIEEIIGRGLHEWVDDFQNDLNEVGAAIHTTFLEVPPLGPTATSPENATPRSPSGAHAGSGDASIASSDTTQPCA
ncbi:MAG: alpha-E domain-containing protein [Deltaproteobacteria bacterium]|nr:alpha-E domain-containing protein [Deltaproteobacteria bacterium]